MMSSRVGYFARGLPLCTVLLWVGAGLPAHAESPVECTLSALQALAPEDTTLTAVALVPADGILPDYCRVDGYVTTPQPVNTVNFRLGLPTAWNRKLYFQGVGGRGGTIGSLNAGLARGYASASTDTGHQGSAVDSTWAFDDPDHAKEIDYGYRGTHLTAVAAKSLTHAYYGRPPQHAYFSGCSNGGRQALIEAQRFPEDFDGIVAGDPGYGVGTTLSSISRYHTLLADRDHYLPATKLPLLANAVLADCDAKDGLVDGLIDDPRQCTFDPASLQCPAGDGPDCLTAGQVETVRKIYAGAATSTGELVYPGYPGGHEDGPTGWLQWIVGDGEHLDELPDGTLTFTGSIDPIAGPLRGDPPLGFAFLNDTLRYLTFEVDDPNYNYRTFNFDTDLPLVAFMEEILHATDPDLSRFRALGGKLLMYHGWADPATTPLRSIQYYEAVVAAIGNQPGTDEFLRLFLAPGMHHCGGGPGPNITEALALPVLEQWVEDEIAPNRISASTSPSPAEGGVVGRTRPLCPYPQVARYVGTGSIDQAENFKCTQPEAEQ
jgi:feruloyl esterase